MGQAQAVCERALKNEPRNRRIIFQLGRIYRALELFEKAADFLERAAQDGYAAAKFELAQMLEKRQASNPELSPVELYLSAAENNHVPAMTALAALYLHNAIRKAAQTELKNLLKVDSSVFSIFITARIRTGADTGEDPFAPQREEEQTGTLVRTVRTVLWRRSGDEVELVPIVRWEDIDYVPYEVKDYPDEDR